MFNFNGHDFGELLLVSNVGLSILPPQIVNTHRIVSGTGELFINRSDDTRVIQVDFSLFGETHEDYESNIRTVAELLYTNNPQRLTFDKYPGWFVNAIVEGSTDLDTVVKHGTGTINFSCPDPHKYSSESSKETFNNQSNFSFELSSETESNRSILSAQPIIEVEFRSNTNGFKIEHVESGRHLEVDYGFRAGEVLTLNSRRRSVMVNDNDQLPSLALSSDWFDLVGGDNNFNISPGGVNITITYRVRWL